jgi:hypothetical protein
MQSVPPLSETFKMAGMKVPRMLGTDISDQPSDKPADAGK